jgi:aminoglycoside phosphotransferase family enzyme
VTPEERQQYQLEALHWNRKFASGVYIGLACILGWSYHPNSIVIGEIIKNPTKSMLIPNAEYAIVMQELQKDRRLDFLLNKEGESSFQTYIRLLTEYMAYMHTELVEPPTPSLSNLRWGSYEQVQKKLEENLKLLDLVQIASENNTPDSTNLLKDTLWQMLPRSLFRRYLDHHIKRCRGDLKFPKKLKDILDPLKKNIHQVFSENPYQQYLEQRIKEQRIKHCHGDLKAPHIWIEPQNDQNISEARNYIRVLDAIDFNPTFNNIDILSDLAMILVDLQARTHSPELVNLMIENYLHLTNQKDKISRSVLAYYLVEKAIMWAAVSIVYDDLPELGLTFLEVAKKRMEDLLCGDLIYQAYTLPDIPTTTSLLGYHSRRNHSG